jgi:hypothetical protein
MFDTLSQLAPKSSNRKHDAVTGNVRLKQTIRAESFDHELAWCLAFGSARVASRECAFQNIGRRRNGSTRIMHYDTRPLNIEGRLLTTEFIQYRNGDAVVENTHSTPSAKKFGASSTRRITIFANNPGGYP